MRHPVLLLLLLLVGLAAHAQQPALPGAPAPRPDSLAAPASELVVSHRYEVKLVSGVSFTGRLSSVAATALVFEASGLGQLTIERSSIKQLADMDAVVPVANRRVGYFDIGSGSRYFFGPSGRNLRRGEGVLQDAWLFLVGANYGITDNISIGGYVSLVPGAGLDNQFAMLTPKASFSVAPNWHVGAGAVLLYVPSFDSGSGTGVGLLYGVATRGSADDNVSVGVGYGFASGGVGSTPTLYLAGQTRVSRRLSLASENYVVAAGNPVFFGLYGVKINWPQLSLGVSAGYVGYVDNGNQYNSGDSYFFSSYIYPVYYDLSFRFGKPYQKAATPTY